MDECFKCGVSGDRVELFDAVSNVGISKVCESCATSENIPLVKYNSVTGGFSKRETVYERLSKAAGIDSEEHRKKIEEGRNFSKQEVTLKDLIDKNYEKKLLPNGGGHKEDLIDNFHWVIMRVRRKMRLTSKELAKNIGEPEIAIRVLEKGILPDDYLPLIKKIESYFGVRLLKSKVVEEKEFGLDPVTTKELTVEDLNEMSKKKRSFFPYWRKKLNSIQDKKEAEKEADEILNAENVGMEEPVEQMEESEIKKVLEEELNFGRVEDTNMKARIGETNYGKDDLSQEDIDKILFRREKF